jgi:hypothetical protein
VNLVVRIFRDDSSYDARETFILLILKWKEQLELNKRDVSDKEAFFKYIHKELIL